MGFCSAGTDMETESRGSVRTLLALVASFVLAIGAAPIACAESDAVLWTYDAGG
jgi:hypothetical protein